MAKGVNLFGGGFQEMGYLPISIHLNILCTIIDELRNIYVGHH